MSRRRPQPHGPAQPTDFTLGWCRTLQNTLLQAVGTFYKYKTFMDITFIIQRLITDLEKYICVKNKLLLFVLWLFKSWRFNMCKTFPVQGNTIVICLTSSQCKFYVYLKDTDKIMLCITFCQWVIWLWGYLNKEPGTEPCTSHTTIDADQPVDSEQLFDRKHEKRHEQWYSHRL